MKKPILLTLFLIISAKMCFAQTINNDISETIIALEKVALDK